MSIVERIKDAERRHTNVVDLRKLHIAETNAQLEYETQMDHLVACDMQALMSAVQGLMSKASDEKSREFVKAELDDILLTLGRLQLLASALQCEVKS